MVVENNKVILLIQKKMMDSNWSAFTPDSYYSELSVLSDEEILDFYNKSDEEISNIQEQVQIFYDENN